MSGKYSATMRDFAVKSKMALPIRHVRITHVAWFLVKNSLKSQVIAKNQRTCMYICSQAARRISTSCPRQDSLPPNFYHRNAKVDESIPRTGFVESPEDFKFVERLIPSLKPPTPPVHEKYPTPSGWAPPTGAATDSPYTVRRTRYHSIPVYLELKFDGSQQLTIIKNIEGDIWALAEELKAHLEGFAGYLLPMTVNEVTRQVRFKGMFREETKKWLAEKGF